MGANAQTAVPVFTSGQVLTAAQVTQTNTGIPVFATTVTRDAAFGGTGEKTLAEGQFAYIEATNATQYYDGAAWQAVAGGKVAQVVSTSKTDTFTSASTSYVDITGLSVSITPTAATSKVLVIAQVSGSMDTGVASLFFRMMRDSTAINIGDTAGSRQRATFGFSNTIASEVVSGAASFLDSPATTSATTYKMQGVNSSAGTFYINRSKTDADFAAYARPASSITVMEILA
jgi:hypothetical protein